MKSSNYLIIFILGIIAAVILIYLFGNPFT
ncbi:hypothetical protein ABHD89_000200 [Salinicoccus halitifaciens]|uniref:Uncharacterized protein n=1 Tax=Salinicoccus halitifaciens TaxID=1073415 RepID=A0ABV2E5Y0_9STAP